MRKGGKCIDETIIRCTTLCLAEHNVSRNDVVGIILKTANIIFGQKLSRSYETEEEQDSSESEDENELQFEPVSKRKKEA